MWFIRGSQKESRANFRFFFSAKLVFGVGTPRVFGGLYGEAKRNAARFFVFFFFRQNLFLELVPPVFFVVYKGKPKGTPRDFRFFSAKLVFGVGTPRVFCGL